VLKRNPMQQVSILAAGKQLQQLVTEHGII